MLGGLWLRVEPEPTLTPPHDHAYHTQLAPVPKLPPVTPSTVDEPEQINVGLPVAEVAAVELLSIDISVLAQLVVLHEPSART